VKGLPNATGSEVMVKRSDKGLWLVALSMEARKGVSEAETGTRRRRGARKLLSSTKKE